MTQFDFTEAELNSNRNGFLTPRQKALLGATAHGVRKSSKNGVWIILGFMVLGLGIELALFLFNLDARRLQTLGPQLAVGLCFTVLAILAMIALGLFLSRRQAAQLEAAELLSVDGPVRHDSEYSQSGFRSYYVYFGRKRFAFVDDMSSIFPEGAQFRVYYSKAGPIEMIWSFERLA